MNNKIKVLFMLLLFGAAMTMGCVSHYHYFVLEETQFEITELRDSIKHINIESDKAINIVFIPKYEPNSTVYSKYDVKNVTHYDVDVQFDDEVNLYVYKIGTEDVRVTVKAYK
jgi:hypothetical protein